MDNKEQLLVLEETIKRLENQIKTYEEREKDLEAKFDSIKNERSALDNLLYKISKIYSNLKLKFILEEKNLNLYKYKLTTDYYGTDETGYVLIKKGVDPEIEYAETLNELAIENLNSYGYVSEEDYNCLAEELGIDLDDIEVVEESELADLETSDYGYSIELVTDYSELDVDIEEIERWD